MKKFEDVLICTDLDGTLLSSDGSISAENLEAIEHFKANGGMFTIMSGRVPVTARKICDIVNPNVPFGCINGGGLYDVSKGDYVWINTLPEEGLELVEYVDKMMPEIGIQVNTPDKLYFSKDNTAMEKFRKLVGVPNLACHYRDVAPPISKIVFAHMNEEEILRLIKLLDEHPKSYKFGFIRSEKHLYELLPKGTDKGMALAKLAEMLNLDVKKTVAVGDYYNDIGMIKYAGVGISVANGCDEIKSVADYITVRNDEHAIAHVISDIEKGLISFG